jgi:hypothetical protein
MQIDEQEGEQRGSLFATKRTSSPDLENLATTYPRPSPREASKVPSSNGESYEEAVSNYSEDEIVMMKRLLKR